MVPDRFVRASDLGDQLGPANNPEWKTVAFDASGELVLLTARSVIAGARRPRRPGSVEPRGEGRAARPECRLRLSLLEGDAPAATPRRSRSRTLAASKRPFPQRRAKRRDAAHGARATPVARQYWRATRGAGGHRVRPAGRQLRHRARPRPASRPRAATTTPRPVRRRGRNASPASAARTGYPDCARVRRQRRQDPRRSMIIVGAA